MEVGDGNDVVLAAVHQQQLPLEVAGDLEVGLNLGGLPARAAVIAHNALNAGVAFHPFGGLDRRVVGTGHRHPNLEEVRVNQHGGHRHEATRRPTIDADAFGIDKIELTTMQPS